MSLQTALERNALFVRVFFTSILANFIFGESSGEKVPLKRGS
jgi:hypothetical protein